MNCLAILQRVVSFGRASAEDMPRTALSSEKQNNSHDIPKNLFAHIAMCDSAHTRMVPCYCSRLARGRLLATAVSSRSVAGIWREALVFSEYS
jgi:hypothetical protein